MNSVLELGWPGLKPGPLNPESSAVTSRPPRRKTTYKTTQTRLTAAAKFGVLANFLRGFPMAASFSLTITSCITNILKLCYFFSYFIFRTNRSHRDIIPVLVYPVLTNSPHARFLCCIFSTLIHLPPHPPPLLMQPFAPGSRVPLSLPQVAARQRIEVVVSQMVQNNCFLIFFYPPQSWQSLFLFVNYYLFPLPYLYTR